VGHLVVEVSPAEQGQQPGLLVVSPWEVERYLTRF
jgi:hypothetical protein